jgi:hypothetical protein
MSSALDRAPDDEAGGFQINGDALLETEMAPAIARVLRCCMILCDVASMAESSELIEFWKRWDVIHGPPFAHPDDWPVLRRKGGRYIDEDPKDFAEFVSSPRFGDSGDTRFHLSLLPTPYSGDLRAADIILLVLNPGFALSDYYAESRSPKFCDRLKRTLAQDFAGVDFPFVWLAGVYKLTGRSRVRSCRAHNLQGAASF